MPVEILDYRPYEKNTLRGFLTARVDPIGIIIRDITHHQKGSERWCGLPAKQYEKDGETQWMPIVRFADKQVYARFQAAVFEALDKHLRASPTADVSTNADMPF
jgi:hypothetical protein